MSLLVDTNVFVAAVTDDTDRSDLAREVLNGTPDHDLFTTDLNLMELWTVLSKKKGFERARIEEIEGRIETSLDVQPVRSADVEQARARQRETMLYPLDAVILAAAHAQDGQPVSFDRELADHGAITPEAVLSR